MILRVWDYYKDFKCIAGKCKDSCCIGWEIDIDEDTYAYYRSIEGSFGDRLKKHMYLTKDKEHSFNLQEHGRCPFLNSTNLCDICIELGEEALSEVCTEYPRFSIEYGNVLQKALCLSCEEVGRILFSREDTVKLVDYELGEEDDYCEEITEEEATVISFMESLQNQLILTLQDRSLPLDVRIEKALALSKRAQDALNEDRIELLQMQDQKMESPLQDGAFPWKVTDYEAYLDRFYIFDQMEVLGDEWVEYKESMKAILTEDSYHELLQEYLKHSDYKEADYEQLLVYYIFRYFMNAVYNYDIYSYVMLAVLFTRMILDMDVVRFIKNGKHFSLEDRIDTVRIFSKEVEHSEENVELAREEILF